MMQSGRARLHRRAIGFHTRQIQATELNSVSDGSVAHVQQYLVTKCRNYRLERRAAIEGSLAHNERDSAKCQLTRTGQCHLS